MKSSMLMRPASPFEKKIDWAKARKNKRREVRTKKWVGTVYPMSSVVSIVWSGDWTDFTVTNRRGNFSLLMPGTLAISVGMSLQFTVDCRTDEVVAIHRYAYGRPGEQIYPAGK